MKINTLNYSVGKTNKALEAGSLSVTIIKGLERGPGSFITTELIRTDCTVLEAKGVIKHLV